MIARGLCNHITRMGLQNTANMRDARGIDDRVALQKIIASPKINTSHLMLSSNTTNMRDALMFVYLTVSTVTNRRFRNEEQECKDGGVVYVFFVATLQG